MWSKPWKLPEGFLIGGGLIVAGLILEKTNGPVAWNAFAWPVNGIVVAILLFSLVLMHAMRKKVYVFRFLSTYHAAIPALVLTVALTLLMGLTRQRVDGRGLHNMLTFWPFVLVYVYVALILGLVTLRRIGQFKWSQWRRDIPFFLNHFGLFLALVTATLGNADMQRVKMIAEQGQLEWRALNDQMEVVEMPIAVILKDFIMETYDDGSPRRYASELEIVTRTGKDFMATIDVNHPLKVDGWKIYQFGYDTAMGAESRTSILEFVRDPWLPAVYAGIYMMLAGALLMFFGHKKRKEDEV
ncbi:MAG: cytochrome c biogenesis protein ResB [Bacteroidales bacterium]|nr:cytochrome c biogenesis protein ResB [Bacteroidales bacterium]